jgi:hypothetical protein
MTGRAGFSQCNIILFGIVDEPLDGIVCGKMPHRPVAPLPPKNALAVRDFCLLGNKNMA